MCFNNAVIWLTVHLASVQQFDRDLEKHDGLPKGFRTVITTFQFLYNTSFNRPLMIQSPLSQTPIC